MAIREIAVEELVPTNLVILYEITDAEGIAIWGGTDPNDALYWFRRKSPSGSRVLVTSYDEDGQDAWPNGDAIDITAIVVAAIAGGAA